MGGADFVTQHPELTQLVATAYVKAYHWASQEENRARVIQLSSRQGTPESVVQREYSEVGLSWKERWSPLFDSTLYEHYRGAIALALSKKVIPHGFDFRDTSDERFVKTALSTLLLEGYWNSSPSRID